MWEWFKRVMGRDPKRKVMQRAIDELELLRLQYRAWDDEAITTTIVKGVEKSMHEQLLSKHQAYGFIVFMREETDTHFQREFMAALKQLATDLTPATPDVHVYFGNSEMPKPQQFKLHPPGRVVIRGNFIRKKSKPAQPHVIDQD